MLAAAPPVGRIAPSGERALLAPLPYSHGGFMGAAPLLLRSPMWVAILQALLPEHLVRHAPPLGPCAGASAPRCRHALPARVASTALTLRARVVQEALLAAVGRSSHSVPSWRAIRMMENNPVVAALGALRVGQSLGVQGEHGAQLPAVEWDVYLCPRARRRVNEARWQRPPRAAPHTAASPWRPRAAAAG